MTSPLRAALVSLACVRSLPGPAVLHVLPPDARPATTYGHLLIPGDGKPDAWVVVDPFEEVFTLCLDRDEQARFIDLLRAAHDPDRRLRVPIAVRADLCHQLAEHRCLADALRETGPLLGPMTADELREAVVRPTAEVRLLVELELTARLVAEVLNEPGELPMLSHTPAGDLAAAQEPHVDDRRVRGSR